MSQGIMIAMAIVCHPSLLNAGEPVSALDVSIQAQLLNLLMDIQKELNVAYLFIPHDLSVVRHVSHRVSVMYLGRVVEVADTSGLFLCLFILTLRFCCRLYPILYQMGKSNPYTGKEKLFVLYTLLLGDISIPVVRMIPLSVRNVVLN